MNRAFLLALSLCVVACGDDAPPEEDNQPGPPAPKDASRPDAETQLDASRDAAPGLLDATIEAGEPDASVPVELPDANVLVDAASFDAAIADAGSDAAQCVAEGSDCQAGACCDGTACVTSTAAPFPACLATCNADSDCETGCCTAVSGPTKVCAPASYCEEEDATAPLNVSCFGNRLEVYDSGGTYMGKATTSPFEDDSVCDTFGPYGKNGSSPDKLWSFGSDAYSLSLGLSAVIGCDGDWPVLAYVSKFKGPSNVRVIDPDNLCDVLENSNL